MPVYTDQTGQSLELQTSPQRIISLVPSQTELLADLGASATVVGITKFCVHPDSWFRIKTRVGGTKQLKMDIIHQLQPDLIIANKEENVKEQVEELATNYPVWISDINTLDDAYGMIRQIGLITGTSDTAGNIIATIKANFSQYPAPAAKPRTAYLIWRNPYMTVGADTFIHTMMNAAGFDNMFADRVRYPEVTVEELKRAELLLLSSEPFPFNQKHIDELQPLLPDTKIILVDGELFSWYGSRLQYAPEYFEKLRAHLNIEH